MIRRKTKPDYIAFRAAVIAFARETGLDRESARAILEAEIQNGVLTQCTQQRVLVTDNAIVVRMGRVWGQTYIEAKPLGTFIRSYAPVLGPARAAGRKGGRAPKLRVELVEFLVRKVMPDLGRRNVDGFLEFLRNRGAVSEEEAIAGTNGCDEVWIDESRIHWKDARGAPQSLAFRSIERYLVRAAQEFGEIPTSKKR
jgi:hypothetical protein